jgi:hypothetical protein
MSNNAKTTPETTTKKVIKRVSIALRFRILFLQFLYRLFCYTSHIFVSIIAAA